MKGALWKTGSFVFQVEEGVAVDAEAVFEGGKGRHLVGEKLAGDDVSNVDVVERIFDASIPLTVVIPIDAVHVTSCVMRVEIS